MAQVTPLVLLSEFQDELTGGSGNTSAEPRKRRLIIQASERLQRWSQRRFDEYVDTRTYSSRSVRYGGSVDGQELVLDDDLRSITTITNGDASTISSGYTLLPTNTDHKTRIRLDNTTGVFWTSGTNDHAGSIAVQGKWGFGGEWIDTGDAVADDPFAVGATTLTVTSANNFEVDMTLKIEDEYLLVTALDTGANTLTVERAVNGSTAAQHATGIDIYKWDAYPLAKEAVTWLVLWRLERVKARLAGEAFLGDAGIPVAVSALPREFQDILKLLRRKTNHFGAV